MENLKVREFNQYFLYALSIFGDNPCENEEMIITNGISLSSPPRIVSIAAF